MIAVACPSQPPGGGPFAVLALVVMTGIMLASKRNPKRRI